MKTTFAMIALACALTTGSLDAGTLLATSVSWTNNGTVGSADQRNIATNALGAPDGKFLALGLGGFADFTFGQTFTGPGVSYEVTFGKRNIYTETANVFAGSGGSFLQVGSIDNSSASGFLFNFTGVFDTLRLVDTSPVVSGRDGYDVDAVGVTPVSPGGSASPVPLPVSAVLFAGALAGLSLVRWKGLSVKK